MTSATQAAAPLADLIPASLISAELRALTGDAGPGHRKLIAMAADATICPPLERRNNRWVCPRAKLPELAGLLGLAVQQPEPARRSRRAAAARGEGQGQIAA